MREKELRLALVCYGGISLAVYMHGITKEVWRLARASLNFLEGRPTAPGTQGVYRRLLQTFEERAGIRVRVLVDIVAGASAGGINGVFLAQAVATGQSLEPLTQMWLDVADIDELLDPAAAPTSALTKVWALPIAWMIGKREGADVSRTVEEPARAEVRAKLARFVRSRWFDAPFGGDHLTGRLLDALDAMAAGPAGPRLLPPGQPLDLFVTVTDFRGHPETLRLNSPPQVVETEHRLVVHFSDHGGRDRPDGQLAHAAELAFAARATSSFPGAFPPFTVAELDRVLAARGSDWPGRDAFLRRVIPRAPGDPSADEAALIDGSVLANAPFQPAIGALKDRPARRQIDRRFVFVDPTPALADPAGAATVPGFFQTILGSLSELPRAQPIRDNLEALAARTQRIERMRGVLEAIRGEVESEVESLFGYTLFLDRPTQARLVAWRKRAQTAAAQRAGFGYTVYGRLKVEGVIDRLATLIGDVGRIAGAEDRRAVRAAIADHVASRGEDVIGSNLPGGAGPETIAFLQRFDLSFRIRRLRLMARRLSELESSFERSACEPIRQAIYAALGSYLELQRTDAHPELAALIADKGWTDTAALLHGLAASMDLKQRDDAADTLLAHALAKLDKPVRRPMLLSYLGFPFFDVATLPLLQGEALDEFDPVRVDRISPDDAVAIRGGGAGATLKGIQFNNFGAFFSRAYRENDYLWGRLHGADRLVDILDSTLPPDERLPRHRLNAAKYELFTAILDEEEPRLTAIPEQIAQIRSEVADRLANRRTTS